MNKYCENVPGIAREALRNQWNARVEMKGAQVGIYCPGDTPIALGP